MIGILVLNMLNLTALHVKGAKVILGNLVSIPFHLFLRAFSSVLTKDRLAQSFFLFFFGVPFPFFRFKFAVCTKIVIFFNLFFPPFSPFHFFTDSLDSLRMAIMVQAPNFDGKIPQWYHFDCFFKRGTQGLFSIDQIKGADNLRHEDVERIKNMINKKGGKRVAEAAGSTSSAKRAKNSEKKEDEAVASARDYEWQVKDNLKKSCSLSELRAVLEFNNRSSSGGQQALIDRVADILIYGLPQECPTCGESNLYYNKDSQEYKCSTKTAWGNCLFTATPSTVQCKKWKKPKDLDSEYLSKFKGEVRQRVLRTRAIAGISFVSFKKKYFFYFKGNTREMLYRDIFIL